MIEIPAGSTDQTLDVFVQDSSVTTGDGLAGLVYNSSGLTCYYRKGATGSATQLSLATQTVGGAHADGGFVEIDSTNMEGAYRLDISDTIVATEGFATIFLQGATNMAPVTIRIAVTDPVPEVDVTYWDGQAIVPPPNNGVPVVDVSYLSGSNQSLLDLKDFADAGYDPATNKVEGVKLTDTLTTYTGNTVQTGDSYARIGAAGAGLTEAGGTGDHLTDIIGADSDTLKSLSDQMDGLLAAPGSGSRPYTPTTITVDSGTGASGDADDMEAAGDGNVYTVNDDAGTLTLTLDYQFDEDGQAIEFQLVAAAQGIGDDIDLQFYDVDGTTWDTKETITGANLLIYRTFDRGVVAKYTSQSGLFKARLTGTGLASATLTIDKAVAYAITTTSNANYSGGFIYYDAGASNTNTVPGRDGTDRYPVSTWTAVKSLVTATGLKRVDVVGNLTLDATAEGLVEVRGHGGVLALGTQDIGGVIFSGFNDVTGIGTTTNGNDVGWNFCVAGDSATATIPPSFFRQSQIGDNGIIFGSSGNWNFWFCGSKVDGLGAPVINTNSTDNNNIGFTDWARGKQLTNLSDNDIVTCNGDYNTLTLTGGTPTVNVSGMYGTLNTSGLVSASGVSITNALRKGDVADILDDTGTSGVLLDAAATSAQLVDDLCDEPLTAGTHNVPTSLGRRIRDITADILGTFDVVSATANTITLDATASGDSNDYDPARFLVSEGTGAGQNGHVIEYFGTSGNGNAAKTLILKEDLKTALDVTSKVVVIASNGRISTNQGQLRGGSVTTATLNALAPGADVTGQTLFFTSGAGQDQQALILSYSDPVATFAEIDVAVDATTGYEVLPFSNVAGILGSPAGASVSADIAAVKTDTGNLVTRITATLFTGITSMASWLGIIAGKTADASTLAEVNATTAGVNYTNATDSQEALRDNQGGGSAVNLTSKSDNVTSR